MNKYVFIYPHEPVSYLGGYGSPIFKSFSLWYPYYFSIHTYRIFLNCSINLFYQY